MTSNARKTNAAVALTLVAAECLGLALIYAASVRLTLAGSFSAALTDYLPNFLLFLGCWLAVAYHGNLWSPGRQGMMGAVLLAVLKVAAFATVGNAALMLFFAGSGIHFGFLAAFGLGGISVVAVLQILAILALRMLHQAGFGRRSVLIVGANERTIKLVERLSRDTAYRVEGVLDDDSGRAADLAAYQVPHLGPWSALKAVVRGRCIDDIFVGLPVRSHYDTIRSVVESAENEGLTVQVLADLFRLNHARSIPMREQDVSVLALSPVPEGRFALATKRAMDFVGASVLLALLSPLFLVVAVIIKLDSNGPVFFLQERAGRNQRRFKMVKFRSMVSNAEELRAALAAQNEVDGPAFKLSRDPRVTRFGAFMRKHSIDEFPQLFNVWKGEMSLVGPRPALTMDAEKYTWDQRRRLSVKQGMTGLWQVSGRHGLSFDEWMRLDLNYIDSWSVFKDVAILLKTFREVVQGEHAT